MTFALIADSCPRKFSSWRSLDIAKKPYTECFCYPCIHFISPSSDRGLVDNSRCLPDVSRIHLYLATLAPPKKSTPHLLPIPPYTPPLMLTIIYHFTILLSISVLLSPFLLFILLGFLNLISRASITPLRFDSESSDLQSLISTPSASNSGNSSSVSDNATGRCVCFTFRNFALPLYPHPVLLQ